MNEQLTQDQKAERMAGRLNSAEAAIRYIFAGKGKITLRSAKTQTRFTYAIERAADNPQFPGEAHFVHVLNGPDDFTFLGTIRQRQGWRHGKKSKVSEAALSAVAWAWSWSQLSRGRLPDTLEVWHEGRCGRCGKVLTVPESIASGFGPECIKHVGG